MKRETFALTILCFILALIYTPPLQAQSTGKALILYFSVPENSGVDASTGASRVVVNNTLYGTTAYVAHMIADATEGDLHELKTVRPYPMSTHKELIDYAKQEATNEVNPKLSTPLPNLQTYDVVYIGFPNWWYDMPRIIYTVLSDYNFEGKTIVTFCTHGGSGYSSSVETIKAMAPNSTVLVIPAIASREATTCQKRVTEWLKKNNLTN